MPSTYDKIETENPLLDEIVYNCKLMMKSCILKDEVAATSAETAESARNADIYRAIKENRAQIYFFNVTVDDMRAVLIPPSYIKKYATNLNALPYEYKNKLINHMSNKFLANFEEKNNYYRKLCGLPNYGERGIYITAKDLEGKTLYVNIDARVPIHLMPMEQKQALLDSGVIDDILIRCPKAYYLKHITKQLDSNNIRQIPNHGLVYVNESCEPILLNRFKELIDKNRVYIEKTMDFDAYKYYSTYYDRFIMLIIVTQTVTDMIAEMPEYFIRRDVFDIRTCEYFFEANGVEFFPEIPIKYQRKLVQNLNKLLKYKSTEKNIVDICSLFGFKDISIFKYYLMKSHKTDDAGNYINPADHDVEEVYDLKFIKVPIDENVDDYYKNLSTHQMYDTITASDPYWDGPYDHDLIKRQILNKEFNIVQSKYISIDTVYNLTEISFQMTYFLNMLFYSGIDSKKVTIIVPAINSSTPLPFIDVFMYLFALMYAYQEINDIIVDTPSQYLKVKGFNFDADLSELSAYIAEKGYTLEELGVSGFTIPSSGILTLNQMVSIYINNKNIYDHIIHEMRHADNKKIYDCYKKIYDSLMICELNYNLFYIDKLGRQANSYTEWLKYNNNIIYSQLMETLSIEDVLEKHLFEYNLMNSITKHVIEWIGSDQLTEIFTQFPVENSNYIKSYMYKIINFFKSHKISLLDMQNIYTFDEDKVIIIDECHIDYHFDKNELVKVLEYLADYKVNINTKETMSISELIADTDYTRLFSRKYIDEDVVNDLINKIEVRISKDDKVEFREDIYDFCRLYFRKYMESNIILSKAYLLAKMNKSDSFNIPDNINKLIRRYFRSISDTFTESDFISTMESFINKIDDIGYDEEFIITDRSYIDRFKELFLITSKLNILSKRIVSDKIDISELIDVHPFE